MKKLSNFLCIILSSTMLLSLLSVSVSAQTAVTVFNITVDEPTVGQELATTASLPETASTYVSKLRWTGDLDGQNAKTMDFTISTSDNDKKVRCAVTMFIGSRSYKIYSAPSTLHCTNSYNGYRVDWADDGKSVTITAEEGATPANICLKAEIRSKIPLFFSNLPTKSIIFSVPLNPYFFLSSIDKDVFPLRKS